MKRKPFLTIGIASYNYANYLRKAFEQIKKQQFKDFEILYCDDGSTDESVAVIESIIKENPDMQIRLIKGSNEGLLANRNRIVENADGEYLLICDADDYMADNCLEFLCSTAKEKGADCVIGGFSEVDGRGNIYKIHVPMKNANKWIYIWHHAQIYKMELVRQHSLRFVSIPDDLCFIQKIHQYAQTTEFVSENVYYWVRHSDSTSRDIDNNSDWHPRKLWTSIVNCTLEIQKEIRDEADSRALSYFLLKWFYFNITDLPTVNKEELKDSIKVIQCDMKRICSKYRKISFLRCVLKAEDTLFAKMAILGCWLLEGIDCIKLLPIIRTNQQRMRG